MFRTEKSVTVLLARLFTCTLSLSQFGFIAYENEEGKNLFFHMSEVEGEVELQASL